MEYVTGKSPVGCLGVSDHRDISRWFEKFPRQVGIGSAADDLSGSRRTAVMTSSVVSCEKALNDAPEPTRLNVGGGASLVLDHTFSTLSTKKRLNVSTSI